MLKKRLNKPKLVLPISGLILLTAAYTAAAYTINRLEDRRIENFVREAPKKKTEVKYPITAIDDFYGYEDVPEWKGDALLHYFRKYFKKDNPDVEEFNLHYNDSVIVRDLDRDNLVGLAEVYDALSGLK